HDVAATGGTAAQVLWSLWDACGVAPAWRDAAVRGSARDDADLDAVIALMKAAEHHAIRLPEAAPRDFVQYLVSQDLGADSLAARGQSVDAVTLATPATAAGREWSLVVVTGLDEGVWPNARLRDSVLGAQHLADVLAGRAPAAPREDSGGAT